MGFLSNLFGQKHKDQQRSFLLSEKEGLAPADIGLYYQIVDVIVFSEIAKTKLKASLAQAFADPKSFYDENGNFILSQRGLTFPKSIALTSKFVFIDTLIAEKQMAEVDWKEEEAEIRIQVRKIMITKQFPVLLSAEEKYENSYTHEVIQLINNEELIPNGYSLQILDINSDCYVFTIIPAETGKTVGEMFARL